MEEIRKILEQMLAYIGAEGTTLAILYHIIMVLAAFGIAWLAGYICKRIIVSLIMKITSKTNSDWDEKVFNRKVLNSLSNIVPAIVIWQLLPMIFHQFLFVEELLKRATAIYITVMAVRTLIVFADSLRNVESNKNVSMQQYFQSFCGIFKVIIIFIAVIVVIAILLNKSPMTLIAGLGATSAILMLVFKDMIMGLVAGVQLSANDMLRPGDWISMPKYGADGDVIEVTLSTVKVRNWDKTITTIPPYALVSDSFQNWRGMKECGGRRVKRSVFLDMRSVTFCTKSQIKDFRDKGWLDGLDREDHFVVNLHVFRNYMEDYLRHHPRVNRNLTVMVRQLQPTAQGLPLELYFFSDGTDWVPYEHLQSEIFEHVLAIMPVFGLRVFQAPMGTDFSGKD